AVANNVPIADSAWHAADVADTSDTCPWNKDNFGVRAGPAGQAYYDSVAKLYAGWGIDFLKVDCIADHPYKGDEIRMIGEALRKTGRPIVLSLSPGPTAIDKAAEVSGLAQMWRISDDFWDHWGPWAGHDWSQGLLGQFASAAKWAAVGGPGHWPMGGNLLALDDYTLSLLTNPEVIAVDQHSVDNHASASSDKLVRWEARPVSGPGHYMAVFNLSDGPSAIHWNPLSTTKVRDLWARQDLPSGRIDVKLAPHACTLYLITGPPPYEIASPPAH
ncbi:MAG: glycoside hydrolase family 27 protein, partial [Bryobacteraceae bacterium]